MSKLDLSQAKSLAGGGSSDAPQGPVCHRTMAMVPMQGGVAGLTGALLTSPCLREKCSLWVPEKARCAEACLEDTSDAT